MLARRETDGFYYLGRVVQEVKVTAYWEFGCKGMYVFFSSALPISPQCQALAVGWPSSITVYFIAAVTSHTLFSSVTWCFWLFAVRSPASKSSLEINQFL